MPKKVLPILVVAAIGFLTGGIGLAPAGGLAFSFGAAALQAGISPAPKGVSMTLEPRGTE